MDEYLDGYLIAMTGFIAVFSLIALALYLVASFARYRYLRIRSYENAWMAFIPIANIWAIVEATYGKSERINIYGWDAPAVVLKLWPMVAYVIAIVINVIPFIGNALSLLLSILNIAVLAMIFKDMMEHLEKPQDTVTAVIAVIIRIVSDIMILSACGSFEPGQQNWQMDTRIPGSQTTTEGPLSFLNGKI
ncbi:MAG: hypothetical protein K6F86_03920 [Lachnospiraceae bacterium]|nr:hypothetical protein [Lachnospiraceae bacterium]